MMLSRSVALFIAFVLFWSGFTTQEQALSPASIAGAQVGMAMTGDSPRHDPSGSVEDHHLDDQPAQAQVEGGMDLPVLIQHPAEAQAPVLAMVRPIPHVMAVWLTPTLDGLRRPPRGINPA
ncbi:MAG: hypothetical protein H7Z19_06310 [Chitinophagaceae bacterium]|nr:hypothetical protein [Rubrivivax sp.]